jgi:hypothetical protein
MLKKTRQFSARYFQKYPLEKMVKKMVKVNQFIANEITLFDM